jgi:hypothetical protein
VTAHDLYALELERTAAPLDCRDDDGRLRRLPLERWLAESTGTISRSTTASPLAGSALLYGARVRAAGSGRRRRPDQ